MCAACVNSDTEFIDDTFGFCALAAFCSTVHCGAHSVTNSQTKKWDT